MQGISFKYCVLSPKLICFIYPVWVPVVTFSTGKRTDKLHRTHILFLKPFIIRKLFNLTLTVILTYTYIFVTFCDNQKII